MLSALAVGPGAVTVAGPPLEISATGDISSGRIAVEYALRGCTSFQIHTLFQLPACEYKGRCGSKVERALLDLYFHPQDGFIVWARHAARRLGLEREGGLVRFLDLAQRGAQPGVEDALTSPDAGG